MRNKRLLFMVEIAVFSALAFIFDLLANVVSFSLWPQGGSVSIAMVPVFLMAYRWGVKGGVTAGLLLGLLQILSGTAYIMHPVQGFLDYIVAYTVVGLAGVVFKYADRERIGKKDMKTSGIIVLGILMGSAMRFLAHFIAGIVFFGTGAADGQSVAVFSLFYNLSYMLQSVIVSGMVMILLFAAAPRVILRKSVHHS